MHKDNINIHLTKMNGINNTAILKHFIHLVYNNRYIISK